jgi:hypothetical protein
MHMAGFFPSVPSQVNFELMYAPVEGQWRLFGISVSIGQAAPVAPDPAAPGGNAPANGAAAKSAAKPAAPAKQAPKQ